MRSKSSMEITLVPSALSTTPVYFFLGLMLLISLNLESFLPVHFLESHWLKSIIYRSICSSGYLMTFHLPCSSSFSSSEELAFMSVYYQFNSGLGVRLHRVVISISPTQQRLTIVSGSNRQLNSSRQLTMFSRIGVNRSPQHKNVPEGRRKVILPATVFNKPDRQLSWNRQPQLQANRSLTPKHKMQLIIQPSKSKPHLLANKSKHSQLDSWQHYESSKTSMCQNVSALANRSQQSDRNWKQASRSINDPKKRKQLVDVFQSVKTTYQTVEESKENLQVDLERLNNNYVQEKSKVEGFYDRIFSVLQKHKQGMLLVCEHWYLKSKSEMQETLAHMGISINQLIKLQGGIYDSLPKLQSFPDHIFRDEVRKFRTKIDELSSHQYTLTTKHVPQVNLSSENIVSQELIDLLERWMSLPPVSNHKGKAWEHPGGSVIQSIECVTDSVLGPKLGADRNPLGKYISIEDGSQSDQEYLLNSIK